MKKMYILGLFVLPALFLSFSGCYTQYERGYSNSDRDYRSGEYSDYDDYADTSYSREGETTINNYYDSPGYPVYKRYFWGYQPGLTLSLGYYDDYYYGSYYGSYWSPYVDWPWCGTYYPSYWWNWYPRYDNYCYYYPGGHHGHHGWNNGGRDIKYRDNNTAQLRGSTGLRNSGGSRGILTRDRSGSETRIDSRLRPSLTGRDRGTDRIGNLRTSVATRQRDNERTSTREVTRSGGTSWNRDASRGTVNRETIGRGTSRTGINDSKGNGRTREETSVRAGRDNSGRTERTSGTVRRDETGSNRGGTVTRTPRETQRENTREAKPREGRENRDTKVDREKQSNRNDIQQRSSIREYQQRSREQRKEERRLYSAPRNEGQQNSAPSRNRDNSGSRDNSSRREYSAPPARSSAPSSAPATRSSNPPSRSNNGGNDSRRSR